MIVALVVAAASAITACEEAAPRPPTTDPGGSGQPPPTTDTGGADAGDGGGGGGGSEEQPPNSYSWTISADHFGDESALLAQTTNRSAPYVWDRIPADGEVRVAIAGREVPFISTRTSPIFADDLSGAEWTVTAEVSGGAVVLVLTAPDQTEDTDFIGAVTVTNPGSGYTSAPAVTFGDAPAGGTTATGTAA